MKSKLLVIAIALTFASAANAQSWDKAQSELWDFVAQSWVDDTGETGKWPGEYIHDSIMSWDAAWPVPRGAASIAKWTRLRDETTEVLSYELFPLAIIVEGNTGVAYYSVVSIRKTREEDPKRSVEGIVETLHKTNGRLKYLALTSFSMDDDD